MVKSLFDPIYSCSLYPHEKRILAMVVAFLIFVVSFLSGIFIAIDSSVLHYDRSSDQIIVTLFGTQFSRENSSLNP